MLLFSFHCRAVCYWLYKINSQMLYLYFCAYIVIGLKISRQIFNQKEWSQVFPALHPCRKCLACVFITLFESLRLFLLAKLLLFFYVTLLKSILLHDKPTVKRSKLILTLSRSLQTLSHPKDNRNLFIFAKSPYSGAWNFHSRSV